MKTDNRTIERQVHSFMRRLPIGAEVQANGGVHFRVWAPDWDRLELVLESEVNDNGAKGPLVEPMLAEEDGYFSAYVPAATAGTRYRYRLNGKSTFPDPASRWQPEGPHGPSEVVDPADYQWHDSGWAGVSLPHQIIYEMHIGTFTPEGTFAAAARELVNLASLGITVIEIMPVNEFDGQFGWGYDGVDLFAPTHLYGSPDDLRRFVDEAHAQGLAVLLDVVYNHFGPNGNYATTFAKAYSSQKHKTDWGEAINFDGKGSRPVREFFTSNAGYWIDEFHFDGLRIDAIHAIVDDSPEHILTAIVRRVRQAARGRRTLVVGENELQQTHLVRSPADGGYDMEAVWNDDFHHVMRIAATGHNEFYYGDYQGTPQEMISAVKWGYLYQGQWNLRQGKHRGSPAWDLPGMRFITFLQNHDQIANSAQGLRMQWLTSPGRHRALTALLLLSPGTPMLFQGQEFAASAPFLYFADHHVDLAKLVRDGRQEFLRQFHSLTGPQGGSNLADPCDRRTFELCKLDFDERQQHADIYRLHRDLIRLRREDAVFSTQRAERLHGAVIAAEAMLLRFFGDRDDDRVVIVNLGRDLLWAPVAEPLASPPNAKDWKLLWSSEDPKYGGSGTGLLDTRQWRIPGHTTLVLCPGEQGE